MINNKKVIVIIPARSGSVGIKNKNIIKFVNKPLLAWPIIAANKSKYVDSVIVSTDSKKIAKIANKYGGNTPFIRPKYLATNTSSSIDVISHVIKFLTKKNDDYFYIILLEPTSPFTTTADIDKSLNILEKMQKLYNTLVGVHKTVKYQPKISVQLGKNNQLLNIKNSISSHKPRQKLSDAYYPDGSIYITTKESFLKRKTFYHNKTIGYISPKWKSIEIDDELDLILAKAIFKNKKILQKKYGE